jgi:hypothetical protein
METRSTVRLAVAVLLLAGAAAKESKADLITTNPGLPPGPGGGYMTATQVHAAYPGVVISEVDHTGFNSIQLVQSGANEIENFNSVLNGAATINGSSVPFTLTGTVSIEAFDKWGVTTGTFNTQMLSMDLTGNVGGHSVEIMLDPALGNSTGQTTITDISGGHGTLFDIHSFFDVFTEISLDHGPFQGQTNGATLVTLQSVPEPGSWMIVVSAGLTVPAYLRWRARRASPARAAGR